MSLIRTASAAFYALGAEIARHLWNCGAASALQVYQHCSFGHAARLPDGELIKDLLLPTLPRTWRRRAGGQLKTWATTINADLEPISGPRALGWLKVSSELAQDCRAWSASVRDVANSIGDAGSTRPG